MLKMIIATVFATVAMAQAAQAHTRYYQVRANSTQTIDLRLCGSVVDVDVKGDSDTDLDFEIVNPYGRVIHRDYDDDTDYTWKTIYRSSGCQHYTLRVINRGDVYNEYRVSVN